MKKKEYKRKINTLLNTLLNIDDFLEHRYKDCTVKEVRDHVMELVDDGMEDLRGVRGKILDEVTR